MAELLYPKELNFLNKNGETPGMTSFCEELPELIKF